MRWYDRWVATHVFAHFPQFCQYRIWSWLHYKQYSIWNWWYYWLPFVHNYENSHLEGLTIDLTSIIQFLMDKTIERANDNIYSISDDLSPYPITILNYGLIEGSGTWYLKQNAQHQSVQCAIMEAVMLSMWITENRTNPGNGISDGFWGTETGPWSLETLIHKNRDSDQPHQPLMQCSGKLMWQRILNAPLRKGP